MLCILLLLLVCYYDIAVSRGVTSIEAEEAVASSLFLQALAIYTRYKLIQYIPPSTIHYF